MSTKPLMRSRPGKRCRTNTQATIVPKMAWTVTTTRLIHNVFQNDEKISGWLRAERLAPMPCSKAPMASAVIGVMIRNATYPTTRAIKTPPAHLLLMRSSQAGIELWTLEKVARVGLVALILFPSWNDAFAGNLRTSTGQRQWLPSRWKRRSLPAGTPIPLHRTHRQPRFVKGMGYFRPQ